MTYGYNDTRLRHVYATSTPRLRHVYATSTPRLRHVYATSTPRLRHVYATSTRLKGPSWTDELPWVLLGIRTAPKQDLGTSSAELVYGAPLTVPGDFVALPATPPVPAVELQRLRDTVRMFVPIPTSRHGNIKSRMPPALEESEFVFIRRDAHRTALQATYGYGYTVTDIRLLVTVLGGVL
jgi:hypothetical protein